MTFVKNTMNLLNHLVSTTSRLELVSVHIPKTAGTSFRHTLQDIYGKNVVRLDIRLNMHEPPMLNDQLWDKNYLPSDIRVLHGHFSPKALYQIFGVDRSIPVITWVRDPVKRVISQFNYLEADIMSMVDKSGFDRAKMKRMMIKVDQFAAQERNRNLLTKFMEGKALNEYTFIGVMENYKEDLDDLGNLLGWHKYNSFHLNTGIPKELKPISEELIQVIREYNKLDIELYKTVLEMREQRKAGRN